MPQPETIRWVGEIEGHVELLDQTLLPTTIERLDIRDVEAMRSAIQRLSIRGAPAIGVATAYGVVIGLQSHLNLAPADFSEAFASVCERLASARPTAVNGLWAVDRLSRLQRSHQHLEPTEQLGLILKEARQIHVEDQELCAAMGRHGGALIKDGGRYLTHCNAGALATGGQGTALSVFFDAHRNGKSFEVLADETRPLLQGARLTMWELMQAGISCRLICDNMAAHAMKTLGIDGVFTGADRVAGNGDAANKIGTYSLALAARAHKVPFYVVAPSSTFDLSIQSGEDIPIEERDPEEILSGFGSRTAPEGAQVWSPAFDVTPASLLTGLITEKGLLTSITTETVANHVSP